ncbi:sodium/glutamate symporter [Conservatibacter flavescens]|uniref:Sodium/glutamate symporter n=1 Tax=Conservatibacter flavescens TaxID=28161 RepID=A0A2M8S1F4_9PAST|nr:sodium/glutamate symporter [Conservatibacter flavescens]PJG84989.1 sodium/glutamate symporter [Conservatibacter flavescens]
MTFDTYETIALACLVLLLGYFLVKRVHFLSHYNIPEPVVGGFIVAIALTVTHQLWNVSFSFDTDLQYNMMLVFFSSIGLSANFARLAKGGKPLLLFLCVSFGLIFLQNTVGIFSAMALGLDPAYGLIAGSVTLTGGHGTGVAWADTLTHRFGISGALELAMACATFGLVFGGIIGGPVASFLLKRMKKEEVTEADEDTNDVEEAFERPKYRRKVNTRSIIETITMMSICLFVGQYISEVVKGTVLQLPAFVWCLFVGTLIRNVLAHIFKFKVADEAIDILGNVGLSLFLAIALMSLKLWELAGLALPIFAILIIQVLLMVGYAIIVTYRVMGKDYDAVVLSAGHCGFGLGATPTAVANMQAVTSHFGPSHKAFLIVPMVGAFFIDLINNVLLKFFMEVTVYFH